MTTAPRFVLWLACFLFALFARTASAQSLPLNITTNYSDPSQVYITFQASLTNFSASYTDATSGQTTKVVLQTYGSNLSQSIPLSSIKNGLITVGYMDSGLIYASIGGPVNLSSTGAAPAPTDPNDPAYNIPWQVIAEITYTNTPADSGDMTTIQFFSIPSAVQVLTGTNTVVQQAQINVAPATLYSQISALSSTPDTVAIKSTTGPDTGKIVRVLAPNQFGQTTNTKGTTYFAIGGYPSFQNYVNSIYQGNVSTNISGTIQETVNSVTNTVTYNFTSTVNSSLDIVTVGTYTTTPAGGSPTTSQQYTITIPHDYPLTDGSGITNYCQSSALYFCPSSAYGAYFPGSTTINTTDTGVTVNDPSTIDPYILSQVLHDLTAGYNFGFINSATLDPVTKIPFRQEASSTWFKNGTNALTYAALQPDNPYYNQYANLIATASQGTSYGFPYADAVAGVTLNTVQYPNGTPNPPAVTGWNIFIGATGTTPGTQPQTITFPTIPNQTYGNPPFTLSATASSGLPVSYSVSGPASVSGNVLTIKGAGTVNVKASQAGNSTYKAATPVTKSFTVAKASQTITFNAIPTQYVGRRITLSATASSGFPVSYVVTGPAKLAGKTLITTGAGTVKVIASQAGNANVNAATSVAQSFIVNLAPQSITFPTIPNQNYGNPPFTLAATASSGLPVTYTASGPATVSGNTVTITGVGTATIKASQPGNGEYAAAKDVAKNFVINKQVQTITFPPIPSPQTVGAVFQVMASSSAGLPVTLSVNSGPATISGNTVTVTGTGNVKIKAVQAGNATVAAAPSILQGFSATQ